MLRGCSPYPYPKPMPPRSALPSIRAANCRPPSSCAGCFPASPTTRIHGCALGLLPDGRRCRCSRLSHVRSVGGHARQRNRPRQFRHMTKIMNLSHAATSSKTLPLQRNAPLAGVAAACRGDPIGAQMCSRRLATAQQAPTSLCCTMIFRHLTTDIGAGLARTNGTPLLVRISRQRKNGGHVGKPLHISFRISDQSDMVFRADLASVFPHVLIQYRSVRKTSDFRHCRHQQHEQGDRHFWRISAVSPPVCSWYVCLCVPEGVFR